MLKRGRILSYCLFVLFFLFVSFSFPALSLGSARYIFLFIGDGMGLSQLELSKALYGELLIFKLQYSGKVETLSFDGKVPDSASAATALATGYKTVNGVIGMDHTKTKKLKSIAYMAKEKGLKVGVITDVPLDDATPAAFYSSQPSRFNYYEIMLDLFKSGFDYFAGSVLIGDSEKHRKGRPGAEKLAREHNYRLLRSLDAVKGGSLRGKKVVLLCDMDRHKGGVTLADVVKAGIDHLYNERGFLMVVEEGKIDWACHANDARGVVERVKALDEAVKVAFDFYSKHPEETLIVVTADHETGGMEIGPSLEVRWKTKGHTSTPVPIFALGVGSALFNRYLDNADVAKNIMKIAGLTF